MALRQALFNEDPTNADYRRILAISYQNTGDYLDMRKDKDGAVENFRKKLALDETSYAADPDSAQTREDLAYSCQRLGELLADLGDYTAASGYDQRSVELNEKYLATDPGDVPIHLRAAIASARLGEAQAKTGDEKNARKQCEHAAALLEETPDDRGAINQRSLRTHAYVKLGDAYIAIVELKKGSKTDLDRARVLYQRALDIMQDDLDRGLLNPDDEAEMREVVTKMAKCNESSAR
jgi:tetratricopeptide (TPR) repeat protein